jgi:DNA ligase-1
MIIDFKPMLFPNEKPDLDKIKYPMFCSTKLDGIRVIFIDGRMLSRSLKEIPNKQLQLKFQNLKDYSFNNNVILDGEIYALKTSFQSIVHYVMTDDLGSEVLPNNIQFFCFDAIINSVTRPFSERYEYIKNLKLNNMVLVKQTVVKSKEEVEAMFQSALDGGFEGLILKSTNSKYKFGRISPNSGDGYKCKPFLTFDAEIIAVEERFENTSEAFTNELGRSQKHVYKDKKEHTGIATCFVVIYEGQQQRVTITGNEDFRREIWDNKTSYIGKKIEFKGMSIGSKDKVRHPIFVRFREDV